MTYSLKLYTEAKNAKSIIHLLDTSFRAYSISYARGAWNSKAEASLIAEVITAEASDFAKLEAIAEVIKTGNNQEAILITSQEIQTKLI